MDYNVVMTADAEQDLDGFLSYLLCVKNNKQAAQNLLDDFGQTKNIL